ncbi:MAG TPA: tetratricopeptide repeat protein [Anaeromyxobacteraceae bacterium]|nr:tetratricopeptide repeat protein [Anaeromyxobacteraceae bacterium]
MDDRDVSPPPRERSFLAELRRRHVFRTSSAYLLGAFAVLQGVDMVRQAFDWPRWILLTGMGIAVVGFPLNVFLAWQAYDQDDDAWTTFARKLPRPTWILVGVLAVAAAGVAIWRFSVPGKPPPASLTVLVADLQNRTGEGVFDGTLEPALGLALEGASFVNAFRRETARKIAEDLRLEGSGLDEKRARLVAQREGIGVVTGGSIEKTASGYRVSLRAIDAFTGKEMVEASEEVPSKDAALPAAGKLAARVRAALGDATPEAAQLQQAETFSAGSLDAAHAYALGMRATEEGRTDEAVRQFQEAVRLDPRMGRAWSGLAVVEQNRGRNAEAERYFEKAMANVDRMSEREKYRSRSVYYLHKDDVDKAIEDLVPLLQKYPGDNAGHANLAVAWQLKRDFRKAIESGRRAVEISPKKVAQRNNLGLFEMYAGNFEAAIREQQKVLELSPGFPSGYVGLALAQYASGKRDDAIATWNRLASFGGDSASLAAEGLADLAILEGRLSDARALLEKGIEDDARAGRDEPLGRKSAMLGGLHLATGQPARAAAVAERGRGPGSPDYVLFQIGLVQAGAGEERKARAIAEELGGRLGADSRMYGKVLESALATRKKNHVEGVARAGEALKLVDAWLARLALGRAYLEAGAFAQAQQELEAAVHRRGEATDAFLQIAPTYRLLGTAQYTLARAQEGLKSPAAVESYKAFLAMKRGSDDPLVADAKKRAGVP